jgi:hypothetical protein
MATEYSLYTGDTACNIFKKDGIQIAYPDDEIINIFGPIYAPRIYGKDLTALEIASSGSVTIALNDVHALDLWNSGNTTYMTSLSNNSLKFVVGKESNSTLAFSTSNYDITAYSQSNYAATACNDINLLAHHNVLLTASNNWTSKAQKQVLLEAVDNSVALKAHAQAVTLTLDQTDDSLKGVAAQTVSFTAAKDFSAIASSNVVITATEDATLTASGGNVVVDLMHPTNDLALYALNNVGTTASNNWTTKAKKAAVLEAVDESVALKAHAQAVTLTLDNADDSLKGVAAQTVSFTAAKDFTATASSNVTVTATEDATLSASGGKVLVELVHPTDALNLFANSNLTATASNNLTAQAKKAVVVEAVDQSVALKAHAQAVTLTLDNVDDSLKGVAAQTVSFTAAKDFTATASSNVTVTATEDATLSASGGKVLVELVHPTDALNLFANSNLTATASNNLTAQAKKAVVVEAVDQSVALKAHSQAVTLTLDNADDSLKGVAARTVSFTAAKDFTATASSNVTVTATENASVIASDGNVRVDLVHPTNDLALYALNNLTSTASNNWTSTAKKAATLEAVDETLLLKAHNNAMWIKFDHTDDSIKGLSGNEINLYAPSNIKLASSNTAQIVATEGVLVESATSNVTIKAHNNAMSIVMDPLTDTMYLNAVGGVQIGSSGDSVQNSQGSYIFKVNSDEKFAITSTGAKVTGDLRVTGVIDTLDFHVNELWVNDKQVVLATTDNSATPVEDGIQNDESGLRIFGFAAGDSTSNVASPIAEKSLLWHSIGSTSNLGAQNGVANEPFWELKGGHFRLTHTKNSEGKYVSFAFRVNEKDELEFVKITRVDSNVAPVVKKIAMFGQSGTVV